MTMECPCCGRIVEVPTADKRTIAELCRTPGMSTRLRHALEHAPFLLVNDLALLSDKDLLFILPKCGCVSLAELRRLVPFIQSPAALVLGAHWRAVRRQQQERAKEAERQREEADYQRRLAIRLREADERDRQRAEREARQRT